MKKIVSLYIIAVALIFSSCTKDNAPTTAKYVTVNLQIGADTTLNLSGGSIPLITVTVPKNLSEKPISQHEPLLTVLMFPTLYLKYQNNSLHILLASDD